MTHATNKNDWKNNYNPIGPIILLAKFSFKNLV